MDIPKIGNLNENHIEYNSISSNAADSGDCYGDCELAEVGCELNIFEEEERFALSAYLPDMDQETFWSTMKDLLGGNNMFFDSPLATFFSNLKSGFYQENVSCYKDCIQTLQNVKCSHSLRSYHENMVKSFSDMKRIWDPYGPTLSVVERIRIWKAWKNDQNDRVLLLDLNEYPKDEISPKVETMITVATPPPLSSGYRVLKRKPKGVLRIFPKDPAIKKEPPRENVSSLIETSVSNTSRFAHLPWPVHRSSTSDYEVGGSTYYRRSHPHITATADQGKSFPNSIRYGTSSENILKEVKSEGVFMKPVSNGRAMKLNDQSATLTSLPKTYKRRKFLTSKPSTMETNFVGKISEEGDYPNESLKSLKIRLKTTR
ncbi:hypothetical protein ACHQM5_018092 [Ranunculus cassubicifolius]